MPLLFYPLLTEADATQLPVEHKLLRIQATCVMATNITTQARHDCEKITFTCNVSHWRGKISMKNSKCAISKLHKRNGRPGRCGKMNKTRRQAETEQKRTRAEKEREQRRRTEERAEKERDVATSRATRV